MFIETLLELLSGYLVDITTQHSLYSLPPGDASISKIEYYTLIFLVVKALHVPKDGLYRSQPHMGLGGIIHGHVKRLGVLFSEVSRMPSLY